MALCPPKGPGGSGGHCPYPNVVTTITAMRRTHSRVRLSRRYVIDPEFVGSSGGWAYDPRDMEQLTELIKAGARTPRARLEEPVAAAESAGQVLRRLAREER